MSVVVACRFLKAISIFADCRVSYGKANPVDDNLQKLYQIDKRMVLGFAGPLSGAYQVMEIVRKNLRIYPRRPVAINLLTDMERWIRHQYREIQRSEDRKNLSFILATVEPRREALSKWRSSDRKEIPKPKWFPYVPELRVIALRPSKSRPEELVKEEKGKNICKIIGVQPEVRNAVQEQIEKLYGFAFKQPKLQAQAIVNTLMIMFMERNIRTVGGLFQCAVLSTDGIQWQTYNLPSNVGNVTLDIVDGRYIQRDNVTGRTVPLRTIWGWWQERQAGSLPGNSGVFEDPALRQAVDDFREAENNQTQPLPGSG